MEEARRRWKAEQEHVIAMADAHLQSARLKSALQASLSPAPLPLPLSSPSLPLPLSVAPLPLSL